VIYNDITRRYFDAMSDVGALSGAAVFRGAAGDRAQGTWVQFDVRTERGCVLEMRFLAFGCPHTIAVAAWLTEQARGQPAVRALPQTVQQLSERFAVPIEKMGRLLIIEDAWLAAFGAAVE
jgi:NifU-like protein involved in Fe-S cluster formation